MIFQVDDKFYDVEKIPTREKIIEIVKEIKKLDLFEKYNFWLWGSSTNLIVGGEDWKGDFDIAVTSDHFDLNEIELVLNQCFDIAVEKKLMIDIQYLVTPATCSSEISNKNYILPWELIGRTFRNFNTNEVFENLYYRDSSKFVKKFSQEVLIPYGQVSYGNHIPVKVDKWWKFRRANIVDRFYGVDCVGNKLWRCTLKLPSRKFWKRQWGVDKPIYHPPINLKEL